VSDITNSKKLTNSLLDIDLLLVEFWMQFDSFHGACGIILDVECSIKKQTCGRICFARIGHQCEFTIKCKRSGKQGTGFVSKWLI
jgi:hypothetical protein